MSVAVACNLSDGLVLGVDSAVTVSCGQSTKIYDNAEKIFQLGNKRVGIAIYGLAGLGERSIGSFIREFESKDPAGVIARDCPMSEIAEALRLFFQEAYLRTVGAWLEGIKGKPFDQIPLMEKPLLGLVVGGYSSGAFSSEVWQILIPNNADPNSGVIMTAPGIFGLTWYATSTPIQRYMNGIDSDLLFELGEYIARVMGRQLSPAEQDDVNAIVKRHQYRYVYNSMPIQAGIQCVRFLVDLAINHFRFVEGDSIVGGTPKLGVVTYRGETFRLLD